MRRPLLLSVFGCATLLHVAASSSAKEEGEELWGEKSAGVHIALTISRATYAISEGIECRVQIQNTGESDFSFEVLPLFRTFTFEVKNAKGETVELTAYGKKIVSASDEGETMRMQLKKGESYSCQVFHLERIYDFSQDGEYTIAVSLSLPRESPDKKFSVVSKRQKLSIVTPKEFRLADIPPEKQK